MTELRTVDGLDEHAFARALAEVTQVLEGKGFDYVVIGGIPAIAYGRPHSTEDIDLLVRPNEADAVLDALAEAGFATKQEDPRWIYKAWLEGVLIDVIFRVKREVYLDDEMVERSRLRPYGEVQVRMCAPEDGIVIEALSHDDGRPLHWYNALAMLADQELDWEYLLRRARLGPRRILSLLVYAQSNDLPVPNDVIAELYREVYA